MPARGARKALEKRICVKVEGVRLDKARRCEARPKNGAMLLNTLALQPNDRCRLQRQLEFLAKARELPFVGIDEPAATPRQPSFRKSPRRRLEEAAAHAGQAADFRWPVGFDEKRGGAAGRLGAEMLLGLQHRNTRVRGEPRRQADA